MSSRSVRRRQHKQLKRVVSLDEQQRLAHANQLLSDWSEEARRRARFLGAPAAWRLVTDPRMRTVMQELDRSGELLADLRRACAEAIADVADRCMVRSCRPVGMSLNRQATS